ncbi:MAG: 50S ribosomal protein L25 [Acidimicrobiia bacterium]
MDQVTLAAQHRKLAGTRPARRMRRDGRIPAVVYGRGIDPIHVSVDKLALYSALRSETGFNTLFSLDVDGGDPVLTVAREVQRHPVRNEITHLDFIKVSLDVEIEAEVNLEFVGVPVTVAQEGAILDTIETSVMVLALPTAVPNSIELDVSALEIGDTLHISDLPAIDGVTYVADPEHTLVTVLAPRLEEVVEPVEGEEVEEGEEPAEGADEAGQAAGSGDEDQS